MSQSDISPVLDVPGRTPSEPASPDHTGNLSIEGGHRPGDSSPESPILDVFALDGTCMGEFLIFPIESQSYIEMHTTPDFPKYEASIPSDLAQLQVMSQHFKGLTPYKLERSKSALFAEWYYHFIIKLSKIDGELADYCHYAPDKFRENYSGTEAEITRAVARVKTAFSAAFKANLGSLFDEEYRTLFSRELVETTFARSLADEADQNDLVLRKVQLIQIAKKGKLAPLLDFLKALRVSEEGMWIQISEVCLADVPTEEVRFFIKGKLNSFQDASGSFQNRVRRFEELLRMKKYFPPSELLKANNSSSATTSQKRKFSETSPSATDTASQGLNSKQRKSQLWREKKQLARQERQTGGGNGNQVYKKDGSGKYPAPARKNPNIDLITTGPKGNVTHPDIPKQSPAYLVPRSFLWDTGSQLHLVDDASVLVNPKQVTFPFQAGNTLHFATSVGEIYCRAADDTVLHLTSVYHAPTFKRNIVSPSHLTGFHAYESEGELIRVETGQSLGPSIDSRPHLLVTLLPAEFQVLGQREVASVSHMFNGLVNVFYEDNLLNAQNKRRAESYKWHYRFGHPNAEHFRELAKQRGLTDIDHVPLSECTGCQLGKFTHTYSKQATPLVPVTKPFEVLHVDICGPFTQPISYDNAQYFLTVVDAYSSLVYALPLADKALATRVLIDHIRRCKTDLNAENWPRFVYLDNGSEFQNKRFTKFCTKKGIQLQFTNTYLSYQNGKAERMHRTIQEKARALLASANMPLIFWSEAVRHAVYLLNMTPRRSLNWQTPLAMWYGSEKISKYPKLSTFGCLASVSYPKALKSSKFGPTTVHCAYLGRSQQRNGHKFFVYDPPHVFESNQATFHDLKFYFELFKVDPLLHSHIRTNKSPLHILPGIRYPPESRGRTKEESLEDHARLQALFQMKDDAIASFRLRQPHSSSSIDATSHSSTAKAHPASEQVAGSASVDGNVHEVSEDYTRPAPGSSDHDLVDVHSRPDFLRMMFPDLGVPYQDDALSSDLDDDYYSDEEPRLVSRGRKDTSVRTPLTTVQCIEELEDGSRVLLTRRFKALCSTGESRLIPCLDSVEILQHDVNEFMAQLADLRLDVPGSYTAAMNVDEDGKWKAACESEWNSLMENKTFHAVDCPPGVTPIGCRWVFTVKDSGLHKARLVAKGYTQVENIDFEDTFAPVIKHASVRVLFALAAQHNMKINQLDVSTAFLNADIDRDLYMKQPPGYYLTPDGVKNSLKTKSEFVLKLDKSIYGLKQAPQMWNKTISKELVSMGFTKSINEPCLYFKREGSTLVLLALYVDDLLVASQSQAEIDKVKQSLSERFKMKDLGTVGKFLGINVEVHDTYTKIHLGDYIESLLWDFDMEKCHMKYTPALKDDLGIDECVQEELCDQSEYRSIVGKLLYAANTVRFDISFIVLRLSKFLSQPRNKHLAAARRVLQYLKGTKSHGIIYKHNIITGIVSYSDANFAPLDDPKSRSTTGQMITLGGSPVCWLSKLQTLTALSTTNAEMVALCDTAADSVWLKNLVTELGLPTSCHLYCDNMAAIETTSKDKVQKGTRHVRYKAHFVKQLVDMGVVTLSYVATKDNIADVFTKALDRVTFQKLRLLGMLEDQA